MTRTRTKLVTALALSLGLALLLVACDQDKTSTQESTVTTAQQDAAPAAQPTPPPQCPPPMPPPCATDADCAGGCPSAMGCTCRALPNDGPSVCMVKCAAATDCQAPPDAPPGAQAAACQDGVCALPPPPQGPPPLPPPCAGDADCADGCPSAMGCTCRALPDDGPSVCMVKCAAATDCQAPPDAPPGAPAAACQDGVCALPPPPRCPPPLPPPCTADADCASRCPPDAAGCACRALPNHGPSVCLMTCAGATDCPSGPGRPPLGCQDGVCVPPPPPAGAPPATT